MGIGFFLYMFVNSTWFLFGVQILIGFADAIIWPAFDVLYTKHTTKTKIGREWGAWEAMDYFSATVGAFIGGAIATFFGFNAVFLVMGILCFASAIYIYHLPRKAL